MILLSTDATIGLGNRDCDIGSHLVAQRVEAWLGDTEEGVGCGSGPGSVDSHQVCGGVEGEELMVR